MGLNAEPCVLGKPPAILIRPDGRVTVFGGDTTNATCRDHSAAALAWALGVLSAELQATLEAPGKGEASCEPMFALIEEVDSLVALCEARD